MIWVVGNRGMLGARLCYVLRKASMEAVGTGRELSILDPSSLADFAKAKEISWIVNCAAYTSVDKAEDEADLARRLNAEGPENLGSLARLIGARVLQLSTDYVFDGMVNRPYREEDPVGPQSLYGRTKAEGEGRLVDACPNSIILRTAWLYGGPGPNFVHTMLGLMRAKVEIGVVADQRGAPTWTQDLVQVILALIGAPYIPAGIYHYTNGGEASRHEFAMEIQRQGLSRGFLTAPCRVKAVSAGQYPAKAKRPAYSVLSTAKIEKTLSLIPPRWEESLDAYFEGGLKT